MREDRDSLVERLHRQTAEYSAFKLENERLKVCRESRGWDRWGDCKGAGGWAPAMTVRVFRGPGGSSVIKKLWSPEGLDSSPTPAPHQLQDWGETSPPLLLRFP